MAMVTFVTADGIARNVGVADGVSVIEAAVENGVRGIDGDCGGNCACATCHVFVDERWAGATGEQSAIEAAMLDYAEGVAANSRVACRIVMRAALDGLIIRTRIAALTRHRREGLIPTRGRAKVAA